MGAFRPTIVRATIQPRLLSDGSLATVLVAGGGYRCPYRFGGVDYRSGLMAIPRFTVEVDWNETGWTGGVLPQTGALVWCPSLYSDYVAFSNQVLWADAAVTIEIGEELDGGVEPSTWTTVLVGNVAGASAEAGQITLTIADMSDKLGVPLVKATFAGTGGIEGPTEARGRVKRRNFGKCWNVEGRILDKANAIWEFGDPAFQSTSFDTVRDIGRNASPAPTVVAWAGSVAATFAALQAATVVQGSAAVAPSIQCVKWWTTPVGPLTADITGETSGPAATLAQYILANTGAIASISNAERDACNTARPGNCGVHIDDDRKTIAQVLDDLFLGVSTIWVADNSGAVKLRPITFSSPVETIASDSVVRSKVFAPHKNRKVGYKRNNRQHTDAELSAVLTGGLGDGNRIRYSLFEAGIYGWAKLFTVPGGLSSTLFSGLANGKNYLKSEPTVTGTSQIFAIGQDWSNKMFRFPLTGGERVALSSGIEIQGPAAVSWQLTLVELDASGTSTTTIVAAGTGPVAYNTRVGGFVDIASTTVEGFLQFIFRNNTATSGYMSYALIEPMVTSAADDQVELPPFTAGPTGEAGADITASVVGPPTAEVYYDNSGTSFQDGPDMDYKVQTAVGTRTSGVTMYLVVTEGSFNGITPASGPVGLSVVSGIASFPISAMTTDTCTYQVFATLNGRVLPAFTTKLTKVKAAAVPPPSGGGGGGSSSQTSGFAALNSSSFTVLTNTLTITLPTGKTTARANIDLSYKYPKSTDGAGPWNVEYKLQRLISGVWTDQGSLQNSNPDSYINVDTEIPTAVAGQMVAQIDTTGLTAGSSYDYRVLGRVSSGGLSTNGKTITFSTTGVGVALTAP